jgi:hypothetical protein
MEQHECHHNDVVAGCREGQLGRIGDDPLTNRRRAAEHAFGSVGGDHQRSWRSTTDRGQQRSHSGAQVEDPLG